MVEKDYKKTTSIGIKILDHDRVDNIAESILPRFTEDATIVEKDYKKTISIGIKFLTNFLKILRNFLKMSIFMM